MRSVAAGMSERCLALFANDSRKWRWGLYRETYKKCLNLNRGTFPKSTFGYATRYNLKLKQDQLSNIESVIIL